MSPFKINLISITCNVIMVLNNWFSGENRFSNPDTKFISGNIDLFCTGILFLGLLLLFPLKEFPLKHEVGANDSMPIRRFLMFTYYLSYLMICFLISLVSSYGYII